MKITPEHIAIYRAGGACAAGIEEAERVGEYHLLRVDYRRWVACSFKAPPSVLAELARDADLDVRRYVAVNPNTPGDVLVELGHLFGLAHLVAARNILAAARTVIVFADPDADDCLADAAYRYVDKYPECKDWDLSPRWASEEREDVELTVPFHAGVRLMTWDEMDEHGEEVVAQVSRLLPSPWHTATDGDGLYVTE